MAIVHSCVPECAQGPFPRGFPNRILGGPDITTNNISSLTFENCSIGGIDIGVLLRTKDPAFNVTWDMVSKIVVDGQRIVPPDNVCAHELGSTCGEYSGGGRACETCCGTHQHALRVAGCTSADCTLFCSQNE